MGWTGLDLSLLFPVRLCPVTSGGQQRLTPRTPLRKKHVRMDKEWPGGSHDMYSGHVIEMSHEHV